MTGTDPLGSLVVRLGADFSDITSAFRRLESNTVKLGRKMQSLGKGLSTYVTAPVVALGAVSVAAFDKQAKAIAAVENGLRNVGGAVGFTSEKLQAMASGLQQTSLFGDEEILDGVTANLLTFGGITGEVFERAQAAALDLSARLGTDLSGSAIMLGKALSDPVRGMTALSKNGVVFTDAQKEVVKQLVATGRAAEAQNLILAEVEKYYGGAAEAAARAGTGPMKQFANNLGDLTETFGQIILVGLNPLLNGLNDLVVRLQAMPAPFKVAIVVAAGLAAAIGPLLAVIGTLLVVLPKVKAALLALNRSTIILTAKIIAITAVVAAFAGAAYLIYKNWDGVKAFFQDLWTGVVGATSAAMRLVGARVREGFLRVVREMSDLASKMLEPARRVASALGADEVVDQIARMQSAVSNVVPASAVTNAERQAARLSAELRSFGGKVADTFRGAGASIQTELTAAWDQASAAVGQATGGLLGAGDAAADAGDAASMLRGELERTGDAAPAAATKLDAITVSARRLASTLGQATMSWAELNAEAGQLAAAPAQAARAAREGLPTRDAARVDELPDPELVFGYQLAFDALRSSVDGVASAVGDAVGELFAWRNPIESIREAALSLGRSLGQVFRRVVADITAAIAKALILRGLLALTGGGGFLGGALASLAGGAGKTGGSPLAIAINVSASGEMRMGNGYLLAGVRAALADEVRTGRGDGTLFGTG